jgi:hypothetical protein
MSRDDARDVDADATWAVTVALIEVDAIEL